MFQIISGKFYSNETVFDNPTEVYLYSNAKIAECVEVAGVQLTLTDTESKEDSHVYRYCVSFNNKIERQNDSFSIINAWSDVVLYQIKNLLTFFFDSFWDEDEATVNKMCKKRVGKKSRLDFVPANYLRANLEQDIQLDESLISQGIRNIEKLISLSRQDYVIITACIRTYCASIRLLETDPNLAYSILVFALESLSQSYDEYEPIWDDYDEGVKNKLEKIYKKLDIQIADEIKSVLLKDSQLKLSKRFLHFIISQLDDGYFLNPDITNKILKDDVEEALKNAYNIRSKYAHALKLIIDQSAVDDISKVSDFHRDAGKPYLTYSGLLRLSQYVISNFILKRESVEKESIDWMEGLPGIISAKLAPEFWMSKMESDKCIGASTRLEGYVQGIYTNRAYDISDVMKMYISKFDQVQEEIKRSIFSLCVLWKISVKHAEAEIELYDQFIEKNEKRLHVCCIQNIILYTLLDVDDYCCKWDKNEIENVLLDYIKKRKNGKPFLFPTLAEVNMYVLASELLEADAEKRERWISKAKYASANNPIVFEVVSGDLKPKEKREEIWKHIWNTEDLKKS